MHVCSQRMPTPPSGSQIGSSARPLTKRQQQKRKQEQKKAEAKLQRLTLILRAVPTWSQLERLTKEAKALVTAQHKPLKPEFIFLAILSLIAAQTVAVSGESYWAYIPKPPLIHPVGWLDSDYIKVLTNDTDLLGGTQDYCERPNSSALLNFEGDLTPPPICLALHGYPPLGCLPVNYRIFLTDSPDPASVNPKHGPRFIWE